MGHINGKMAILWRFIMINTDSIQKILLATSALFFIIFALGLLWISGINQADIAQGTWTFMVLLAFASGLTMIILPCTLPLVFIIVPLAASKDYKKGFIMALLFGIGLSLTISFYGIAMAYFGQIFGIKAATPIVITIAGLAAYLFGISSLGIITIRLPFFSSIIPTFIQRQNDYIKSFSLGLLLGNAGIGCPNPLFYVLLLYIASTANIASGFAMGLIHGLGRALPIVLITILAMFGFQATTVLISSRTIIEKITAWMLIIMGVFLIPAGIFNLRGWWMFATSPYYPAFILAALLIVFPFLLSFIVSKHKEIRRD